MNATFKPCTSMITLAKKMIAHALDHKGGTFDFEGNLIDPPFYVVGGAGESIKITIYDDQNNLGAVDRLAAYLQRQGTKGGAAPLVGVWFEDSVLYIDNVSVHVSYVDAVTQGFARDQISIWDGDKGEVIYLKKGE